ncbi:hypothetical protein Tco_0381770 [Tanacetum coccineum]
MLAPKCPTFNGRPTFANPRYLKKAQNAIPCLYAIPHDQSDPANRLVPDREETQTLEKESRSKLNKDLVKPFDYIKLNSLYEIFKPPTQHYEIQFAQANEIRKKMWRKSFVKTKPNIFKNIDFLPVSKSISKSRQAYNVMTNNINHLKEIVTQAWVKHSNDLFHLRNPTAQDMEILVKTCLMPLALKTQNDSFAFVNGVDTNIEQPSILGKPPVQSIRNQPVVRQPTAYKSERYQCPQQRFASQVDVSNKLTKPATPHSWHQMKESSLAKPNDLIAPGPSRNCPKHVSLQSPREKVGSNDMVHNYYLEKAKKSAQLQKDKDVNGKPSMIDPARLPNTANGCKPKPRNWQASMSSRVSNKDVHLGEHRKQKPFLKFNDLQCPTCKKCLYSANHDECVLEYLSRLNPRASAQNKDAKSHKTTKRYMPVEKSCALETRKTDLNRHIGTSFNGQKQQRIDLNADALYNEKQENLRVCSGLAPPRQMTSDHNSSELGIHDHSNELSSSKLVPKVVPPADKTDTSRQELELPFHHHIRMLRSTSIMLIAEIEDDIIGPSDAMHKPLPSIRFLSKENCLICPGDTHDFILLSHSELVDIE